MFEAGRRTRIFDEALALLGVDADPALVDLLVGIYRTHVPTIDLAADAASILPTTEAAPVGLVTDGPSGTQQAKVRALGLESLLDFIVYTDALGPGYGKPHPRAFELVEAWAAPVAFRSPMWRTIRSRISSHQGRAAGGPCKWCGRGGCTSWRPMPPMSPRPDHQPGRARRLSRSLQCGGPDSGHRRIADWLLPGGRCTCGYCRLPAPIRLISPHIARAASSPSEVRRLLVAPVQTLGRRVSRFWRDETSLRARLVNISHLLTGNLLGSVIGMLGFLVTARALGATDYGVLALIYSYTRAVGLLVGFQSWQPLIKYGAELAGVEHLDDYRSLLKFGLAVDVSAALLSYLTAIGFALLFGPLVGIGEETDQVFIYSTGCSFR